MNRSVLATSLSAMLALLVTSCGGAASATLGGSSASGAASVAAAPASSAPASGAGAAASGPGATGSGAASPAGSSGAAGSSAGAAASGAASAASGSSAGAAAGGDIKLGVVAPVTGIQAILGTSERNGIQMAVDEINAGGGINGKKVTIDLADAGADNTTALNAMIKVVGDKPSAIMASPVSTQNLAMGPTVKQSDIPAFFASTADVLTTLGDGYYRLVVRDSVSLPAATAFIKNDLKKTKIGVIYVNDEYGTGSANLAKKAAADSGMQIVADVPFGADTRDYSPYLLKIKNAGAEVMMVYAYPVNVAAIIKQRLPLGLTMPLMGANPIGQSSVLNLVTEQEADGAYGTGTPDPAARASIPAVQDWLTKFKARFNVAGDTYAAAYYDGVMLMKQAIMAENGASDPASIKKGLLTIKDYEGISSPFTCVADGDCTHVTWVVQDHGKTPTILKVVAEQGFNAPAK